ncbi:chitin synthase-domain-containing protein [Chytridium lagenaria]|nr:chitin synthase-domain-containing protein [Chytridium lagenaria]
MIHMDPSLQAPSPVSYISIADGSKQHNQAYVFAGHYRVGTAEIPTIVVVKCGTPDEITSKKPGNRGKRDSQLILMNFLSRCFILMVDADTKIEDTALLHMINAMKSDESIMGLCGETRISNKTASWVSMIQVFEYYISHHLGKAFESVFGGVTCLPGCFCMYRVKASNGLEGYFVPILVNPDIVEEYSENIVDTLHKKNLLLLGEDRFLSTLMLRTFPKRKMIFVPKAICRTVVPDEFKVLLSQRRRWINSTIHNLLELVLVRDLCGVFCFSMQFVVLLELLGTIVLPAAISFTIYLIIKLILAGSVEMIPVLMLIAILGLPGFLIVITSAKVVYVGWMLVYLLALPVWNFVLPLYAFWHFDDFSWGETRKVEGEGKNDHHGEKEGRFDPTAVELRKWEDWERERRARLNGNPSLGSAPNDELYPRAL